MKVCLGLIKNEHINYFRNNSLVKNPADKNGARIFLYRLIDRTKCYIDYIVQYNILRSWLN